MTPENFCYWLQGYFELSKSTALTEAEIREIKEHLKLVFKKVTIEIELPSVDTDKIC